MKLDELSLCGDIYVFRDAVSFVEPQHPSHDMEKAVKHHKRYMENTGMESEKDIVPVPTTGCQNQ